MKLIKKDPNFQIAGLVGDDIIDEYNAAFVEMICQHLKHNKCMIEAFQMQLTPDHENTCERVIDKFARIGPDLFPAQRDAMAKVLKLVLQTFDATKMGVNKKFVESLSQAHPFREIFASFVH